VRYWDASAVVPLLIRQEQSGAMRKALGQDPDVVTWWGTPVECVSAIRRLVREGRLGEPDSRAAERRLTALREAWTEILPGEACRQAAERMLRVHPLRAADALQLAAALLASDHRPFELEIMCLDSRLTEAARREGFPLG
jgi:uncharacterized protein